MTIGRRIGPALVGRAAPAIAGMCLLLIAGCSTADSPPPVGAPDRPERGDASPDDDSGIELDVAEGDRFEPGDALTLVLRNGSDEQVGYNLCTYGLQRRLDGAWQPVEELEPRACTMILYTIEPGETDRYGTRLPDGLSPGTYRFVTNVHLMERGERTDVLSEPIVVTAR